MCGAMLAGFAEKSFGAVGFIAGFFCGATISYFFTWVILVGRLRLFFPLPLCRQRKCQGYDNYHWPVRTIYGWEGWAIYRYRCNCEDEYIRHGKRFIEVLPDGETLSYKKLHGFREWVDDEGGENLV